MSPRDDAHRERLFAELQATGSQQVRNELVESYAPLAEFFAKRYRDRGVEDADLRQVAQLALVKAVDRFDPSHGVQFSTFAGRTMDGELKRYFRDKTWSVRVPRSLQEIAVEVRRVVEQLSVELGRPPIVDEIVEVSGLSADRVLEALDVQTAYRATSMDRPVSGTDGEVTFGSTLGTIEEGFERTELSAAVAALMETVPDREREILHMRFFQELSQNEIADQLGISQMHVSRLLRRTLDQLRASIH